MRNLIVGALTAGILPLINLIGVAATNAIAAAIAWMGFVCVGLSRSPAPADLPTPLSLLHSSLLFVPFV